MNDSDSSVPQQPRRLTLFWPSLVVITAVFSGVLVYRSQLESSRPAAVKRPARAEYEEYQAEARLWQDPLGPVLKAVQQADERRPAAPVEKQLPAPAEKQPRMRPTVPGLEALWEQILFRLLPRPETQPPAPVQPADPSLEALREQIHFRLGLPTDSNGADDAVLPSEDGNGAQIQRKRGVHVLVTIIRDGFSAEDREWRIRTRYALIKALHANGFCAEDTENISYFHAHWLPIGVRSRVEAYPVSSEWNRLIRLCTERRFVCPYEWFSYDSLRDFDRPTRENVLVLWLPESELIDHALTKISLLLDMLELRRLHPGADEQGLPRGRDSFAPMQIPLFLESQTPLAFGFDHIETLKQRHESDADPNATRKRKARIDVIGPPSSGSLRSFVHDQGFFKAHGLKLLRLVAKSRDVARNSPVPAPERAPGVAPPALPAPTSDATVPDAESGGSPADVVSKTPGHLPADSARGETDASIWWQWLDGLKFYSPWSTVEPTLMFDVEKNQTNRRVRKITSSVDLTWGEKGLPLEFLRTIGTDGELAADLLVELRRRGVRLGLGETERGEVGDRITLIYEEDSFYGRAFRVTLAAAYEAIDGGERPDALGEKFYTALARYRTSRKLPLAIQSYGYIRGVDGLLPKKSYQDDSADGGSGSELKFTGHPELPIGQQQLDYARRLAWRIYSDYSHSGVKPKAIGVIGSDVYDKLLLLQALRPYFPDVLFFTTDLDTRLFHYQQYKWTRNLLVASHYGLRLNDEFLVFGGDGSPTFRDSYQTAAYLAGCVALSHRIDEKTVRPVSSESYIGDATARSCMFEVGRDCAVDISAVQEERSIHPPRGKPLPYYGAWTVVGIVLIVLFGCCLLYHASNQFRDLVRFVKRLRSAKRDDLGSSPPFFWLLLLILVGGPALVVAIFLLGNYDHARLVGEPFSITQGISAWPSIILRFLAVVLCAGFIYKARHDLVERAGRIEEHYGLRPGQNAPSYAINATDLFDLCPKWLKYLRDISVDSLEARNEEEIALEPLWYQYKALAYNQHRWNRVLLRSLAYVVFCGALFLVFSVPDPPYRGGLCWWVGNTANVASMLALVLLTFYIVDATVLCRRFIKILATGKTSWPQPALGAQDVARRALNDDEAAEWLDVRTMAEWTETVGKLILYPFAVLLLLILARSSYFDNWTWPIPVVAAYFLILLYALGCAYSLRRRAEKARQAALERLRINLIQVTGATQHDARRADQIRLVIDEIRTIRQGAFSPLTENPILSAILIPSGGAAFLAMWDMWTVFW